MELSRKQMGDMGERIAQKYLKNKGYEIIDSNYRKIYGEIDIIGKLHGKSIVFFEIKTRTVFSGKYGLPEESINYFKQRKLIKTARTFLYEKGYDLNKTDWQFDILTVIIDLKNKKARIRHIDNAFW